MGLFSHTVGPVFGTSVLQSLSGYRWTSKELDKIMFNKIDGYVDTFYLHDMTRYLEDITFKNTAKVKKYIAQPSVLN